MAIIAFLPIFVFIGIPIILLGVLIWTIYRRKAREAPRVRKVDITMRPAGFWRRVLAWCFDVIILAAISFLSLMVYFLHIFLTSTPPFHFATRSEIIGAAYIFSGMVQAVSYVLFLSSRWQATPGKRLMRIYIVSASGCRRLSVAHALARCVAFVVPAVLFIPFMPFEFFTGLETVPRVSFHSPEIMLMFVCSVAAQLYMLIVAITVAFTAEKTGIHDLICKTRALKGRL